MALVRMDIQTIIVGNGPVASLVVLKSRVCKGDIPRQLPIKIGGIEAAAISVGIGETRTTRPVTHDLLATTIRRLGATVKSVAIVDVRGTTFYAKLMLLSVDGYNIEIDCRPSDAIALAVRTGVPILADEKVLETASTPDFNGVEHDEKERDLERFHDFVSSLSPEDFSTSE